MPAEVTPKELREHLLWDLRENKFLVFIWGPPGVGKSSIVQQCAAELSLSVFPLSVALEHPYSLGGFPAINWRERQVDRFPPAYVKVLENAVLFLDDFAASDPSQQRIALSLTTYRRVGDTPLPPSTRIVFASNRVEDLSYIVRPSLAVMNRMKHYTLVPDVSDWLNYLASLGVNPLLRYYASAFLNLFPQKFCVAPSALEKVDVVFPTPRSWHNLLADLDGILKARALALPVVSYDEQRLLKTICESHIGSVGAEFASFLCVDVSKMPSLEKLSELDVYEQVRVVLAAVSLAEDKKKKLEEVLPHLAGEAAAVLSYLLRESSIPLDTKSVLALKSISQQPSQRRQKRR